MKNWFTKRQRPRVGFDSCSCTLDSFVTSFDNRLDNSSDFGSPSRRLSIFVSFRCPNAYFSLLGFCLAPKVNKSTARLIFSLTFADFGKFPTFFQSVKNSLASLQCRSKGFPRFGTNDNVLETLSVLASNPKKLVEFQCRFGSKFEKGENKLTNVQQSFFFSISSHFSPSFTSFLTRFIRSAMTGTKVDNCLADTGFDRFAKFSAFSTGDSFSLALGNLRWFEAEILGEYPFTVDGALRVGPVNGEFSEIATLLPWETKIQNELEKSREYEVSGTKKKLLKNRKIILTRDKLPECCKFSVYNEHYRPNFLCWWIII